MSQLSTTGLPLRTPARARARCVSVRAALALVPMLAADPTWAASGGASGISIAHDSVGCVVAGRHPRFEACLTPAEAVGRAQVQFRASNGPWYYVNMKPDGACYSALLPKPKKETPSFHYYLSVVDRSFSAVQKPDSAPGESFSTRLVASEGDCDPPARGEERAV